MKKFRILILLSVIVAFLIRCNKAYDFPDNGYDDRLSGGAATIFDATSKAFTHPVDGLNARDMQVHELGDASFEQSFVSAPAPVHSGLGPIFNNVSCASCHHNDGKGTPTAGFNNSSLLIRVSLPGEDATGAPLSIPGFGFQLQDQAVFSSKPEAHVNITYSDLPVTYPDGSTVVLRKPTYTLTEPYMSLPAIYNISPRMAPPVFGLGLLENIPESTILSFADENDKDGDGISGRPNYIYDTLSKRKDLGRFGLKANTINILHQAAFAYQQDMGITNYIAPKESSDGELQDDNRKDDPELPDSILNAVAFYVKTLAVPARRNVTDPGVKAGEKIFTQIQCAKCHIPTIQTGTDLTLPQISNQRIHPYTDLLLHDMGDGLADGRPDFLATGKEWRTMPLWGIGLFPKTNGTAYYLHDGRARTIEEAILWHSGEAEKAKDTFMHLNKTEREKLLKFLNSL
jgi:CxxC motif-containing protein (DUF1111 family)